MADLDRNAKVLCYSCGEEQDLDPGQKILRHEECEKCMKHLHCCKMCLFFDATAYNECREPNAERLVEKEKANFCSYFVLEGDHNKSNKDDLRNAANSLFKS